MKNAFIISLVVIVLLGNYPQDKFSTEINYSQVYTYIYLLETINLGLYN